MIIKVVRTPMTSHTIHLISKNVFSANAILKSTPFTNPRQYRKRVITYRFNSLPPFLSVPTGQPAACILHKHFSNAFSCIHAPGFLHTSVWYQP